MATAHSEGEIFSIMHSPPITIINPRAAPTESVVANFCSDNVSDESLDKSSPVSVRSKNAASCLSRAANVCSRRSMATFSPTVTSTRARVMTSTDCAALNMNSEAAALNGVMSALPDRQPSITCPITLGKARLIAELPPSRASPIPRR